MTLEENATSATVRDVSRWIPLTLRAPSRAFAPVAFRLPATKEADP